MTRADHLRWALTSVEPLPTDSLPDRRLVEIAAGDARVTPSEFEAVFPQGPRPAQLPSAEQLDQAHRVGGAVGDPLAALRRVATGTLLKHARRVTPQVDWADLVLPPAQIQRLRGLANRYRYRERVHDEWGLPLFPSPGVVALFSGPSGTGKTMAAEVLAGDLGMDLFRIDLSSLVSKYIGETEKHLEEIFAAAHSGEYVLLFDEADALFGARSKVEDAKDRYANTEVSYLLQRLETYDGFVLLTSNFQGNIDAAFLRRIHATVHFMVPTEADRERIWARSLASAPTDDLDLHFMAVKFDLAGGAIRNACLTAAFLAAADDRSIDMPYLLRAVAQEMQKLGRRTQPDHFGRWVDHFVE